MLVHDLIKDIQKGEVKVPQFQRRFVWKEKQAFDLLDSISNKYPVGSLLLWRTPLRLAAERNIGDFQLPDTDDLSPTNYVLDGQQRLTVIYSCLGAPVDAGGFAAAYDLAKEDFVELDGNAGVTVFPLRLMFNTTKLLNFRTGLLTHPQSETLQERLDEIIDAFTNYRVPVVTLKDLTVEEVCPIFERINSSGTRLSTYDLMVAATWSENFSLDDEAQSIADALRPKGFGDIDGDTILKCLSAVHCRSVKREDVLKLRELKNDKQQLAALVQKTKEALLKSVDVLSTEFHVHSWAFLPYEALVVILCYIHATAGKLNREHVVRVRQWFWRSSFAERYRGASEHFISRDLETIHDFVIKAQGDEKTFGVVPDPAQLKDTGFRSNQSRSRAFVLALATLGPMNITNGIRIDAAEALSIFNQKQFHHIYPQAHLKRKARVDRINSIANICMLAASENNAIGDDDPATYIPECILRLGANASAVFASNALPDPATTDYATLDFDDFLDRRSALIGSVVERLCLGAR